MEVQIAPAAVMRVVAVGLLASVLQSCDLPLGCTLELRPAIGVTVSDSRTGAPLNVPAMVIVRSGTSADTVVAPSGASSAFFDENRIGSGTYSVSVEATGYARWEQSGVRVRKGRCHVESPAALTARLTPLT